MLIEQEVLGALALFGRERPVHLVAGPPQVEPYVAALAEHGFAASVYDPETTTVAGLTRLASAAGLSQPLLR